MIVPVTAAPHASWRIPWPGIVALSLSRDWGAGLTAEQVEAAFEVFGEGVERTSDLESLCSSRLPVPITVFRGVPLPPEQIPYIAGQVGECAALEQGLSCSLNLDTCWAYAHFCPLGSRHSMLRIDVPPRARGALLESVMESWSTYIEARGDDLEDAVDERDEWISQLASNEEWVIPPGGELRLIDRWDEGECTWVHLTLEVDDAPKWSDAVTASLSDPTEYEDPFAFEKTSTESWGLRNAAVAA